MLQELLNILDFDGSNTELRLCIETLMDTNLTQDQEELIYDLAAFAYQLGKEENE
jgi:hypothetical protein